MFLMYDEIIELEDQYLCCCVVLLMVYLVFDGKKIVRNLVMYELQSLVLLRVWRFNIIMQQM